MPDPDREESTVDGRGIRPPDAYSLEVRRGPEGIAVLGLIGEFDLAAAPALHDRLAEVAATGTRGIVLDMAEVTFVDSSALRELLRSDAGLRADGVPLVLAGLCPPVDRLLELTRTTGVLVTAPTVDDALARIKLLVEQP